MKKENIDELLQDSFRNFRPEAPPDAWSGIREGISRITPGTEAAAVKGSSLIVKIALIAAVPAAVGLGYYFYQAKSQQLATTQKQEAISTVPAENTEIQPAAIAVPQVEEKPAAVEKPTVVRKWQSHTTAKPISREEEKQGSSAPSVEPPAARIADPVTAQPLPTEAVTANPPVTKPGPTSKGIQELVSKESRERNERPAPEKAAPAPESAQKPELHTYNVFTPNNDGANDRFSIDIENELTFYLKVVDAKGNVVFETTDKKNSWDGTHMKTGDPCDAGTYRYVVKYQSADSSEPSYIKGVVQLSR